MKKNQITIATGIFILAALVIGGVIWTGKKEETSKSTINSFEECAEAGNPVMESYPKQCRAMDGRLFVEEVEDETIMCAQVITYAKNPQTEECTEFPTPCDVPENWEEC